MYSWLLYFDNRFATSERQWIEGQVENAKQQAILSILKSQVSSDEAHIHRDIHSLRYMLLIIFHGSISFAALYYIHKRISTSKCLEQKRAFILYQSPPISLSFIFRRKGSELAGELSTLSQKVQAFLSEVCGSSTLYLAIYPQVIRLVDHVSGLSLVLLLVLEPEKLYAGVSLKLWLILDFFQKHHLTMYKILLGFRG